MAAGLTVDEELSAALKRLLALGRDQSAAMDSVATMLAGRSRENFTKQASPLGVPWKQSERALKEGGQTLRDKGSLFAAIKQDHGKDFARAGPASGAAAHYYAAIHQFGGRITAKSGKALKTPFGVFAAVNMPARPYLGWNPEMKKEAIHILAEFYRNAIAAKGKT